MKKQLKSLKLKRNNRQIGGKVSHKNSESTRLQQLSLMNHTVLGAVSYDIHLNMKLGFFISRIYQEISLSEFETLYHLCGSKTAQILYHSRLKKNLYAGHLLSGNRSVFIEYEGNIIWCKTCTKKPNHSMSLQTSAVTNEYQFYLKQNLFRRHTLETTSFWVFALMWISKKSQYLTTQSIRR